MNAKKLLGLALALMLMLTSLAACAAGTVSPSAPADQTTAPATQAAESQAPEVEGDVPAEGDKVYNTDVTVQIFQSKVEITEQLEAMAKEYNALTGVKVEVLGASGDQYMDTLVSKLASGQGPTIISVSPGARLEKLNSYLYDISDQPYIADIAENQALIYDGKVVGVPYGVEGYGLVYNKTLVDPAKMADYDSFAALAAELKAGGVEALQLSDKAYFLIAHIFNVPFAMQSDYLGFLDKLAAGEVNMADTAEFQEWAKFMEVIRANAANPMGVTYDDQVASFATGKSAMIHQGNWVWGMFADYGIEFDMGMAPLPVMGNDKICVGMPNAWSINAERDQAEIDEALNLFTWMFTTERGHNYIAQEFNFIPALKSIQVSDLDPLSALVHEYSNAGETLAWTYNMWPDGIVNTGIFPASQKFFSDANMTGQQFLEELDKVWVEGVAAINK